MATYNLGTARGQVSINTSGVQAASKDLKNADIVLRQSGAALVNFGQTALKAFGYVVGVGAKFEKEMSFIQAVTNGTNEDMDKLRQTAIKLAKDGPFGPIALAQSFVELAKAGITAQEIVDGVGQAVTSLASAADITADQAGNIVVQTLAQFDLGAKDAVHAVDLIAGAANASIIEVSDFAATLKYAGPVAHALGISLDDLTTTISLLGQSGIKGSQAGTTLRQTMLNLSGATPKAIDRMKELGIVTAKGNNIFYDTKGNLKGLPEIFDLLGKSVAKLTEKQKTDALRDIFGVRQLPTVLFLLKQGKDKFAEFAETIGSTTALDVQNKRLDNLDGAIKRFKATLEAVLLGPAGPFQNMLKNVVNFGRRLLLAFDRLPKPLKTFIVGAVGVIGVLSILAGVFLLTIGNIVRAVRVVGELATAFSRLPGLIRGIVGANKALAASNTATSATFLTNPVFLVIAALVALGVILYVLYKKWAAFRKAVDDAWQSIQRIWDSILGGVRKANRAISDFLRNLGAKLTPALNKLKSAVTTAFNKVKEFFGSIKGDSIVNGLKRAGYAIQQFSNAVGRFFGRLPGLAKRALGATLKALGNLIAHLPSLLTKGLSALAYGVGYAIGFTIKQLIKLPGRFFEVAKKAVEYFRKGLSYLLPFLRDVFKNIWHIIVETVKVIKNAVVTLFREMFSFLKELLPNLIGWARSLGGGLFSNIMGWLRQLPGNVRGVFGAVFGYLKGLPGTFWSLGGRLARALIDGIMKVLRSLPSLIKDVFLSIVRGIGGFFRGLWDAGWKVGNNLYNGVKDGLDKHSPSNVERAFMDIENQGENTLRALRQQVTGLNRLVPAVVHANRPGGNAGSVTWNQHAPLIGSATIRNDQDIVKLAQEIRAQQAKAARGRGLTLANTPETLILGG